MGRRLLNGIRKCSICGARILAQGYEESHHLCHEMLKKRICYDCAYWQDLLNYPPEYFEVLNNRCVRVHPVADKKDKTLILGGKGKMRYFMRTDMSVIQSNDIWVIGTPPEHFRQYFSPTITEISKKAFLSLKSNGRKCKAKACLDRYACFRYDHAIETECGPYNKVPPKWNVGDEHCRSFINVNEMYI